MIDSDGWVNESNPYPSSGPIRGLLNRRRLGFWTGSGRALLDYYLPGVSGVPFGICRWCEQPLPGDRRSKWHRSCAVAYLVAKGKVVHAGLGRRPLIGKGRCEVCRAKGKEIDHRTALSVARQLEAMGDRKWWRAWTVGNLRWLCRPCHREKTNSDRAWVAELKTRREGVG